MKSAARPSLQLQVRAASGRHAVPFLKTRLRRAHRLLESSLSQLSLSLVDRVEMAALHRRFLGRCGPTDVLSFEIDRDQRGRITAGEVVICVPIARRAARARGISLSNELLLYALHGMLHLCGFDDRTHRAFRAMHTKEDEILTRLGVGPVFRPDPPADRRHSSLPGHRHRSSDRVTR